MAAPLEELVKEWIRLDENETTRNEVQALWDRGQTDELEKRMRCLRAVRGSCSPVG